MKHAYLIIAHKNDYTFHTLLRMLDDERNDIFIHMDKKNTEYRYDEVKKNISKAEMYQVENRKNVVWGDYSQIATELSLLELSTKTGNYDYYHLLSGEDLPLKTQDYIHDFFQQNQGKEFVRFESEQFVWADRVCQYNFFQRIIGKPELHPRLYAINYRFLKLQKMFGIKRNKEVAFQKGANWFSITDALAREVVEKKEWIRRVFKYTECCDEVFLQTIINQSDFKDKLYHKKYDNNLNAIMRLIDWERGEPYIFRNIDIDREILQTTNMLFARKFNCTIDRDIIDYVANTLVI